MKKLLPTQRKERKESPFDFEELKSKKINRMTPFGLQEWKTGKQLELEELKTFDYQSSGHKIVH
jgi:hypothetical protein